MRALAIVIENNHTSESGYRKLKESSASVDNIFFIKRFNAVTPYTVENVLKEYNVTWNWPHAGAQIDEKTGIKKVGYGGRDPLKRKACGMSHYLLWKQCAETNETFLIFEHDAMFVEKLHFQHLIESEYQVIGLNSPFGATRLPAKFDKIVKQSDQHILPAPTIDKPQIAQGLAGNSAYMIKPAGAQKLLELVEEHGMWNNDAIMCNQLMPGMLGVTKTYYTKVQGLPSTNMN